MAWMAPSAAQQSFSDSTTTRMADQVVDVVELLAPHDHLLVDGPQVLRPPGDVGLDAHVVEPLAHVDEDPLEVLLALRRPGRHHLLDLGVALRVQRGEGQVLELPAHLLHAEAVGQRRVDVEGLLGRAALLPLGHHGEGAHVVQPVGQLDQQDPPVVGHGDEHLADGRRLLGLLGVELQAVELGHAVDHPGHAVAEGRPRSSRASARCPPRRRAAGRRRRSGRRGPARPRWSPRPPGA